LYATNACSSNRIGGWFSTQHWYDNTCFERPHFVDNCSELRMTLYRQRAALKRSETMRQSACSGGNSADCSAADSAWQNEKNLYRQLESQYDACMQRNGMFSGTRGANWFDPQIDFWY
jgi:hypothetical protein